MEELNNEMKSNEEVYFTGQAIVVFNRQEERDTAIEYFSVANQ